MNPFSLMELKKAGQQFVQNHPKFPAFLKAVDRQGIKEGTIISFKVETPDGHTLESNIKLKASDIEAYQKSRGILWPRR